MPLSYDGQQQGLSSWDASHVHSEVFSTQGTMVAFIPPFQATWHVVANPAPTL